MGWRRFRLGLRTATDVDSEREHPLTRIRTFPLLTRLNYSHRRSGRFSFNSKTLINIFSIQMNCLILLFLWVTSVSSFTNSSSPYIIIDGCPERNPDYDAKTNPRPKECHWDMGMCPGCDSYVTPGPSPVQTGIPSKGPAARTERPTSKAGSKSGGRSTLFPTFVTTVINKVTASPTISSVPSDVPSGTPTAEPSLAPSQIPSDVPTSTPSVAPSDVPSGTPSSMPSSSPSDAPSGTPSVAPSDSPSDIPSYYPTWISTSKIRCPSSKWVNSTES